MSQKPISLKETGGDLRLVQITDTHLGRKEGDRLLGLDTDFSLGQVLDLALAQQPRIDLALGTGDIAAEGDGDAYHRARSTFGRLRAPTLWLPGNHDDLEAMERILGEKGHLPRSARSEHWLILMLNSRIPGEVGGRLGAAELEFLAEGLEAASRDSLHCLICLHHQPVEVGAAWLDQQMVEDQGEFWRLVESCEKVRGVLWGHVHQQVECRRNGVLLMSTPSSCVQFAPGSETFKVDTAPPGYRWLVLGENGEIQTGVERVTGVEFPVDTESAGYA